MKIIFALLLSTFVTTSSWAACDANTKLMLHCNGTDGSTSFPDDSPSAHTVTATGNAQVDTAQSKFGGASCLLDGTGDYLAIPDHADWDFGTGDFTLELWVRYAGAPSDSYLFGRANGGGNACDILYSSSGVYRVVLMGVIYESAAHTPNLNQWYHIAVSRSGTSLKFFIDGTQSGSTGTSSDNISQTTEYEVGAWTGTAGTFINGWVDEVRISNSARYTSNFTPQTSEFCGTATSTASMFSVFE